MIRRFSTLMAITTAAALLLVSGCMTTEEMNKLMSSWVGDNANNLVASWGPPQQVIPDGAGGSILTYLFARESTSPAVSTTTSTLTASPYGSCNYGTTVSGKSTTITTPAQTHQWTVSRSFWVDKNGVIYRWAWQGL